MSKQFVRDDGTFIIASEKISHNQQLNQAEYDLLVSYASLNPKWHERDLKKLKELAQGWLNIERDLCYAHCRYVNL